ncbi:hypothetical protein Tco_1341643 [Tanacetum coccineum]
MASTGVSSVYSLSLVTPSTVIDGQSSGPFSTEAKIILPFVRFSNDLSSVPTGSVPTGSVSTSSVPTGLVPTGSVPTGSVPTGSVPTGSVPTESTSSVPT